MSNAPTQAPAPAQKLEAARAVLRATITVTRAATGKVETYELIGTVPAKEEPKP